MNNIPLDRCSEQGIVVFNTPGANANAVAGAGHRDADRRQNEIKGKTLGVIGLGAEFNCIRR